MTQETKTQVISTIFALGCVALYFFFPIGRYKSEVFTAVPIFLVLLPVLFVRVVLHKDRAHYGNGSYAISLRDGLVLAIATVVGILLGWVFVKLGWGVEAYRATLPQAIADSFKAFMLFEAVFALLMLWIFTFFAWGFVYHGTMRSRTAAWIAAGVVFFILLFNHFHTPVLLLPLFAPVVTYWWTRGRVHTMYVAWAVFAVNLALDTILIISVV